MRQVQVSTKHIGEQQPINQNPKPGDSSGNNSANNQSNSGNPLKPQETQKGVDLVGEKNS